MTIDNTPSPPHSPIVKYFIEQLIDAPPGAVGLITELPRGQVTMAFMFACKLMGRHGIVMHPRRYDRWASAEFARVLVDDRPNRIGLTSHGVALIHTRMRAKGSGPGEVKWVDIPW